MRRLLLDTCAILRLAAGVGVLSNHALTALEEATAVFVSPISLWEIALKARAGNLQLPNEPRVFFDDVVAYYGLEVLSLSLDVMSKSIDLPLFHRDPADRFIIATALLNNLVVVTTDHRFGQYGVEVLS